jgi:hypothetical protein
VGLWLGGRVLEQRRFGADEASARARVATAVEATVRQIEDALQGVVDRTRVDLEHLQFAAQGEPASERRLFDALLVATAAAPPSVAATLYGMTTLPVAWTGRPLELPDARVTGPDAVFLAPDAQGLRIVRVHPLFDASDAARRVGALVLQAPLARVDQAGEAGDYILPTGLVSVAVRPQFEGGGEAGPDEFVLRSTAGDALASVRVSSSSLERARSSFRRGVEAALVTAVAVLLLLASGPLLDWRRWARSPDAVALATMGVVVLLVAARWLLGLAVDLGGLSGAPLLPPASLDLLRPPAFFASPLHFLSSSLLVAGLVGL